MRVMMTGNVWKFGGLLACAMLFFDPAAICSEPGLILPLPMPLRSSADASSPIDVARGSFDVAADYLYPTQYRVWIPEDAVSIVIEIEGDSVVDNVDLYVRRTLPVSDDEEYVYSSYSSATSADRERIILLPTDSEFLEQGVLFIAIGSATDHGASFQLRLLCQVDERSYEAAESESYVMNVPFLFCQVDEQFAISVPEGWIRVGADEGDDVTIAAFQTPIFTGQATAARLEIARAQLQGDWSLDQLIASLERAYQQEENYIVVSREPTEIDGFPGMRSWVINESQSSGVELACFIHDGNAWLLTLSFAPLGYGSSYDSIFDMLLMTFRLLELEEATNHPSSP